MKRLKYILGLSILIVLAGAFTGCERSYDDPKPARIYTDADFGKGELISIRELKDIYYARFPADHNPNKVEITNDLVIKGKVISDDSEGNVYRTMYIQDETGAIEIKTGITTGYNYFRPGQTIYVACKGLILGNYRHMLSLGAKSTQDKYSNGFIDLKVVLLNDRDKGGKILRGPMTSLTAADTIVITSSAQITDLNNLGRLVRIEGLTHTYGKWPSNTSDVYPFFLEQKTVGGVEVYTNFVYEEAIADWNKYIADSIIWVNSGGVKPNVPAAPKPGNMTGPSYSFKNPEFGLNYYGNALLRFGNTENIEDNLILRTSGYAKFANMLLPSNGQRLNVTAILTKFSSGTGSYPKYQLLINSDDDVVPVN